MNKYFKNKIEIILLILLFVFAFTLRSYKLNSVPPSPNWDEVSIGYNAYSILRTGKDEWGKFLPSLFRAYGDYKLPGYVYLSIPFIAVFGLNETSVRLLSVVAGTLSVLFTYLIVQELFKNKLQNKSHHLPVTNPRVIALLSAFLVAIEPWSLFLSRPAFEANLALCFFLIGFYFFLKATRSIFNIQYSIFFFGLTVWTYNSYRVFTPLFLLVLVFIYRKNLKKLFSSMKTNITSLLIVLLLFLPMFYQLIGGVGQERYKKVEIVDQGAVGEIINLREKYNLSPPISRLLFNRPTYFLYSFSKNVVSHFSYGFLFSEGGSNYQFSVPGFGVLYKVDLIFLLLGIYFLIKQKGETSAVLILWLFLGTVPSALTREAPHVLRSITVLPAPMIITALGLYYCSSLFSGNTLVISLPRNERSSVRGKIKIPLPVAVAILYFSVLGLSLGKYLKVYFGSYRSDFSWSWQYGYKEAVDYVKGVYGNYDKIIITKKYGEPHEFLLFYSVFDPKMFQNEGNLIRFFKSGWYWVDRFDKYYFVNDWDIPKEEWQPFILESGLDDVDCRNIKCLLVTSPGNVPKGFRLLDTIDFLSGQKAFEIYEN